MARRVASISPVRRMNFFAKALKSSTTVCFPLFAGLGELGRNCIDALRLEELPTQRGSPAAPPGNYLPQHLRDRRLRANRNVQKLGSGLAE
jgi:hypothetical protein